MRWNFSHCSLAQRHVFCSTQYRSETEKKSNKLLFVWRWFCCRYWLLLLLATAFEFHINCIGYYVSHSNENNTPVGGSRRSKKLHNQTILLARTHTHIQNHYQYNQYYCSLFCHWIFGRIFSLFAFAFRFAFPQKCLEIGRDGDGMVATS